MDNYQYYRNRKPFTLVDVIIPIVLIILIIATIVALTTPVGTTAEIYVNGTLYGTYQLDKDTQITIDNNLKHNLVVIKDGYVSIDNSNCENKLCTHHSPINQSAQQIICAPNGVVVIVKSKKSHVDGVTGGGL